MIVCFLCLEEVSDAGSCIEVGSKKWDEQNIDNLINMHLWPLAEKNSFSWLCYNCKKELYDFHQFYERIRAVQESFSKEIKDSVEEQNAEERCFLDSKENVGNDQGHDFRDINKSDINKINFEQPLPTEFVIEDQIKSENECNSGNDDIKVKSNRKRGRPSKGKTACATLQDPLLRIKSANRKSQRFNKKSLVSTDDTNLNTEISENGNDIETDDVSNLIDIKDTDESETDVEHHDKKEICADKTKKNHRNLDQKILKEYDKIIAENFKIFCNLCQHGMDNFLSLRKHFKVEHKQRGYARCCKRNFFTRSLLVDHIKVHLNPEHFKCPQCGKVFSDRSRLLCHKKLHEDNSKLDKCEICGKLFADKGALKKHVQTHSSEKLFPCSICGKYFTNSFILNHHIGAVHENKFVQICDICGKSIRCPTAFTSHMEKHEVKVTPISCDICGLLLTNKEGLKRHKNSQHPEGGKKEHTCHICSKVSPTLRALKSHIRSVHEQGFDFKCNLCEKSFKRQAVLREHLATHTGTALYTCPWCPRTFISNGNMYNHRKNAHPKEWEELKRQKYALNA